MEARLCLATLLLLCGLGSVASKEAYATLLYGDAFEAGVRVLGQSLRETRTKRDLVVLVTGNVSSSTVETLRSDGWRVRPVGTIQNPGRWTQTSRHKFPARFWAVYTKLLIFNLTEYERVVYLDADTVVMRNIDDMFLCDGLCGVMRHSERLNTGVMVLEPSETIFKDMMERMATTPSYTGGDQGFLNSYFSDFAAAPFFDPSKGLKLSATKPEWTSVTGIKMGRLPTVFNADTGLFVLNSNRWTLPESEIRILHYTLAVFKPWDYWTSWIMRNVYIWQGLRARLPPNSLGLLYGETQRQYLARLVLLPLPLLLAALLVRRYLWSAGLCGFMQCFCCRLRARLGLHSGSGRLAGNGSGAANGGSAAAGGGSPGAAGCLVASQFQPLLFEGGGAPVSIPPFLPAAAIAAGLGCVAVALGLSARLIIPSQMRPMYGWVMAYEWTTLLFVVFYSQFLRACYVWGQRSVWRGEGFKDDTVKHTSGVRRPWAESLWLFTLIVVGLGLIPWWADIVPGVEAFGAKVVFTAVAGVVTALVCAQAFIELAASWHQCGKVEATHPWSSAAKQLAV